MVYIGTLKLFYFHFQLCGDWKLAPDHVSFDLQQARDVLKACVRLEDWDSSMEAEKLIDEIDAAV